MRILLGLPFGAGGVGSTAALTAPSGVSRFGHSPLPDSGENGRLFAATADERVIEEPGSGVSPGNETATLRGFTAAAPRDHAESSRALHENADERSSLGRPPAEHPVQTRLVIPGVSTRRTAFPALAQGADAPAISVEREQRDAFSQPASPPGDSAFPPRAAEMTTADVELLTKLEHLVSQGVNAPESAQALSGSRVPSSGVFQDPGANNGSAADQDLARRIEHLQRTVRDLAADVSSQAMRSRAESQVQIKRSEGRPATRRAFWERSRLGRFHLKIGR